MPINPRPNRLSTDKPRRKSQRIASKSSKKPQLQQQEAPPKPVKQKQSKKKDTSLSSQHSVQLKKRPKPPLKVQAIATHKRPNELTSNVFSSLYNNPMRIQGFLQIIQWRKKRQNLFSVRLSDGFFRIKTFAKGQVAKQLAKSTIKQFYILDCTVDYQGDKICELRTIKEIWAYGWSVGFTEPWRFDKLNLNPLGSSKIEWDKWDKFVDGVQKNDQKRVDEGNGFGYNETQTEEDTVSLFGSKTNTFDKQRQHQKANQMLNQTNQMLDQMTQSITHTRPKIRKQSISQIMEKQQPTIIIKEQLSDNQKKYVQKSPHSKSSSKSHIKNAQTPKTNQILSKKPLNQKQQEKILIKSQHKQKILRLSNKYSQEDSEGTNQHQHLINKKQSYLSVERTQSLKMEENITSRRKHITEAKNQQQSNDDSWENFFDDFINFKKQTKTQHCVNTQAHNRVDKVKRQMIEELFEDSDLDDNPNPHSFNGKQRSKSQLFQQQSHNLTPQPTKSKKFPFQLFEDSQPAIAFDPLLITPKSSSKKDPPLKEQSSHIEENQSLKVKEKISLKMVSKDLSEFKKNQKHKPYLSVFGEIMVEVDKEYEKKAKQVVVPPKSNHKQQQNNRNQDLTSGLSSPQRLIQQKKLQNTTYPGLVSAGKSLTKSKEIKVFEIQDLLQPNILREIKERQFQWSLRVKILYMDIEQPSKSDSEAPNSMKMAQKIITKSQFFKCLGVSNDNSHLCLLMISKQVIEKYHIIENSSYIISSSKLIQKRQKNEQEQSKIPGCMLDQWLQVGKETTLTRVLGFKQMNQQKDEEWLNELHEIEMGKTGDTLNVMGYIKSVKQRDSNKSKLESSNEDSNSGCYSMKSFTNRPHNTKNPPMTQLQIIDPFTGYIVQFTDFTCSIANPKPYTPIAIFMAQLHIHRNKKSLISRPDTLIVSNRFLPTIKISKFLEFHKQNEAQLPEVLENIEVQLVGYHRAADILQACDYEQAAKIHLDECEMFSITSVRYIGCKYCHKKIFDDECPGCGPCGKDDVFERVLLTGVVSDLTGSFKFFLDKETADKALADHAESDFNRVEQGTLDKSTIWNNCQQKNEQSNPWKVQNLTIQQLLSLQSVQIWFTFQGEQKPISIDKILRVRSVQTLKKMLKQFEEIPAYSDGDKQQVREGFGTILQEEVWEV